MIRTKDLEEFLNLHISGYGDNTKTGEYKQEITKRLRAYDKLCHDLKQMITTLSNGVD